MNKDSFITEKNSSTIISCKIRPSASKTTFVGIYDNCMKFSIAAPPENNKANIEILKFFRKLSKKKVKIIMGLTNKKKVLKFK